MSRPKKEKHLNKEWNRQSDIYKKWWTNQVKTNRERENNRLNIGSF